MEDFIKQVIPQNIPKMRIEVEEVISLYNENKAEILDVRIECETNAWGLNFGLKIPADELPENLNKLPKDKTIIIVCPMTDRSIMSKQYLSSMGYDARYLVGGLFALMDRLKGLKAQDIII